MNRERFINRTTSNDVLQPRPAGKTSSRSKYRQAAQFFVDTIKSTVLFNASVFETQKVLNSTFPNSSVGRAGGC